MSGRPRGCRNVSEVTEARVRVHVRELPRQTTTPPARSIPTCQSQFPWSEVGASADSLLRVSQPKIQELAGPQPLLEALGRFQFKPIKFRSLWL